MVTELNYEFGYCYNIEVNIAFKYTLECNMHKTRTCENSKTIAKLPARESGYISPTTKRDKCIENLSIKLWV